MASKAIFFRSALPVMLWVGFRSFVLVSEFFTLRDFLKPHELNQFSDKIVYVPLVRMRKNEHVSGRKNRLLLNVFLILASYNVFLDIPAK